MTETWFSQLISTCTVWCTDHYGGSERNLPFSCFLHTRDPTRWQTPQPCFRLHARWHNEDVMLSPLPYVSSSMAPKGFELFNRGWAKDSIRELGGLSYESSICALFVEMSYDISTRKNSLTLHIGRSGWMSHRLWSLKKSSVGPEPFRRWKCYCIQIRTN